VRWSAWAGLGPVDLGWSGRSLHTGSPVHLPAGPPQARRAGAEGRLPRCTDQSAVSSRRLSHIRPFPRHLRSLRWDPSLSINDVDASRQVGICRRSTSAFPTDVLELSSSCRRSGGRRRGGSNASKADEGVSSPSELDGREASGRTIQAFPPGRPRTRCTHGPRSRSSARLLQPLRMRTWRDVALLGHVGYRCCFCRLLLPHASSTHRSRSLDNPHLRGLGGGGLGKRRSRRANLLVTSSELQESVTGGRVTTGT
jgi:hypothetical protein